MAAAAASIDASRAANDPDLPKFHLAPPVGRLNDPNGLIVEDGVHHAFYQFSPLHPRKLVYWGHASSTDLLTWRDHGPALAPDCIHDSHGVYSGTAVHTPDGVVLFYTGNVRDEDGGRTSNQCLATTSPDLMTATKHHDNPVVPPLPDSYTPHVRDPQVWADPDGGYRMLLGAQRVDETGCALLLRSPDLTRWSLEGELTFPDSDGRYDRFGYMWECPAIVQVPDEATGELHDVLIFCPQGITVDQAGAAEGLENIFACGYVVGRLEGTAFRQAGDFWELDRGFEFYAPQVVARSEPGPVELMAWVGNASEDDQPSMDFGWVHLMSCVRQLSLRDGRLVQRPTPPFEQAATVELPVSASRIEELEGSRSFLLELEIAPGTGGALTLTIGDPGCHVGFRIADGVLTVDRSTTRYPHGDRRSVTLPEASADGLLRLQLAHDRSVDELFLADGLVSFTMRSYLAPDAAGITVEQTGSLRVVSCRVLSLD
ncbi:MAG: glycoside hydrolase family 32 protein [Luteococcus sp.]|uniref:glycoside hydrolase family 32 protein n=1 Tax=Luteococcus sp. TaxID=1969402 RepID=UPI002649C5C8|nr:glycoside hydrolase family 32 protein [Luteococcus sp.]MDN5563292.1 glycoside hydrolase family 32 protein [Luteococcus sp.]